MDQADWPPRTSYSHALPLKGIDKGPTKQGMDAEPGIKLEQDASGKTHGRWSF